MLKEMIEKILSLAPVENFAFDGRKYTSKVIVPVLSPAPKVLEVLTLTGMADYLASNIDKLQKDHLIIHVLNYQYVAILTDSDPLWKDRHHYLSATCDTLNFPFQTFMDVENFIIGLQSMFVQDEQTAAILKIVGNVKDGTVMGYKDDGISQKVIAKSGVSRVEDVPVPNPVTLAPYRTFLEIKQPASKFIFRMRSGVEAPTCALFEADGGAWKREAVLKIKKWLKINVEGVMIIA